MADINNSGVYKGLLEQLNKIYRHNRQGSYETKKRYFEAEKRFCRFLAEEYRLQKLSNVSSKHFVAYVRSMQERGLSAAHIKTECAAIRFWHDKIPNVKHKLPPNDELNLERRVFGQIDKTWSTPEFHKMIGVCWRHNREDYAAIFCLARYAGLRIHECFRIDTAIAEKAVREMQITIKGKGGKIRTVPIQESIRIELEKMLKVTKRGHKLFVPDDVPTDVAIKQLQQFIIAHRKEVQDPDSDRPMTAHGLRHKYALEKYKELTHCGFSDDEACRCVSQLLGHGRTDVTRIYLAGLKDGEGNV